MGGGSGLGEATARELAARGALVTVVDIDSERAAGVADELGAEHAACDVCDDDALAAAVELAGGEEGLRISVCCAGIGWAEKIAGSRGPHTAEPFRRTIAVNLIGTFNVLRFAAAAMVAARAAGGGRARRVHQYGVDRGVRRPDRAGGLRGVEGRGGRHDPPRRA